MAWRVVVTGAFEVDDADTVGLLLVLPGEATLGLDGCGLGGNDGGDARTPAPAAAATTPASMAAIIGSCMRCWASRPRAKCRCEVSQFAPSPKRTRLRSAHE